MTRELSVIRKNGIAVLAGAALEAVPDFVFIHFPRRG